MRVGLVLFDAGMALMLVAQNLRWGGPANYLSGASLLLSLAQLLSPGKGWPIRCLAILTAVVGAGSLTAVVAQAPWISVAGTLVNDFAPGVLFVMAGLAATAAGTPLLYKCIAHKYALQTRGLLRDMGMKAGVIFVLAAISMPVAQVTPWSGAAPFMLIAVFFLGLILLRSSFVRTSSPEALGYGLLIYRTATHRIRSLIIRSLLTYVLLAVPLALSLIATLLVGGHPQAAVLLVSLVALETGIDALVIQGRPALLPAKAISHLPQKSKAGLGAALCAGMAMVLSGVLGAVTPHSSEAPWLTVASGALIAVAGLLSAVVLMDVTQWLRELSATETEDE